MIRFDARPDRTLRLTYSFDPVVRGHGWGLALVRLGLRELAGCDPVRIVAEVKAENLASRRVFETLGFRRAAAGEDPELLRYTCTIPPR
jgi:RimJ/RimL family protein N-acetyltransferase